MLRLIAVLPFAAACTWVSNAQYDDRAGELEAFRTDFLPAADKVDFLTAVENRVFWVSIEKPLDEPLLHSLDPVTGGRIDYEFTRKDTRISENYTLGTQLVVNCNFSTAKAFSATEPNRMLEMTNMGSDKCAVAGRDVYFFVNRKIRKWTPGVAPIADLVDLDALKVGTGTVAGFAVLGTQLLLAEGARLWLIDITANTATWLENEPISSGNVTFDTRGALFNTQQGTTYLTFLDRAETLLDDMIADGGYHLNSGHDDIHQLADYDEWMFYNSWVVYRGKRGIFAYGLETGKVVDLLLDRGESFDAKPVYRFPSVTADGTLFVQDRNSLNSSDKPVYRVSLTGRLP
jgi:hypothetical protein